MSLSVGQHVWVPCEVKPGPFPDERMVRVDSPVDHWIGFVPAARLREPVQAGPTGVTVLVVDIVDDHFQAQPLGAALRNTVYEDLISRAEPIDSFKG